MIFGACKIMFGKSKKHFSDENDDDDDYDDDDDDD